VKQIRSALLWFSAFLQDKHGGITRTFSLQAFSNTGERIDMILDASPYALGGFLQINGRIVSYFTSPLTDYDVQRFGASIGASDGQQIWEALCLLVALRGWAQHWRASRCTLVVKSDSVSALTLLLHMRPSTHKLAIIAREMALDISEACYRPMCVSHIPGVANKIADTLSRPGGMGWTLPPELAQVKRFTPPVRDDSYFRALVPPS